MNVFLSTLCYMEQDGCWLMLHRVKKQNDVNKDKWIGVGGHFEGDESPEECLLREVREETGVVLTSWRARGIVTFVYDDIVEYMHLFTADAWTGDMILGDDCAEGILEWVPFAQVSALPLWEGDHIFLRLLRCEEPFFLLKLVYDLDNTLSKVVLNGKELLPADRVAIVNRVV